MHIAEILNPDFSGPRALNCYNWLHEWFYTPVEGTIFVWDEALPGLIVSDDDDLVVQCVVFGGSRIIDAWINARRHRVILIKY